MTETQQLLAAITERQGEQGEMLKALSQNMSKLTESMSDIKTLQANQHHLDSRMDAHLATEKELDHRINVVEKNQILLSEFTSNAKKLVWLGLGTIIPAFIISFLIMYKTYDPDSQKNMTQAIEKLASTVEDIKKKP